jgi:hypothetical protein
MRLASALAALLAGFAIAGCAKTLDTGDAEALANKAVSADASRGYVKDTSCPDDVEPKDGATFKCDVTTEKGKYVVTIKMSDITDDGAHIVVTDIQES